LPGFKKSDCVHFAVDSNHFVESKEIHKIVHSLLGTGMYYQIKRIRKEHSQYNRLSIQKSVKEQKIREAIKSISRSKCWQIKDDRNKGLKTKVKDRCEEITILTLNISKIQN
jgi:hypothetical protein